MAITPVQFFPRATGAAPAASAAATASANVTKDNWLVAVCNAGFGSYGTAPTGWNVTDTQGNAYTSRAAASASGNRIGVFTAVAGSTGPLTTTATFTGAGVDSDQGLTVFECSPLDAANLVDLLVQISDEVNFATVFNVTTAATDFADELVLAIACPRGNGAFNASPSPAVPPAGFTTLFKVDSGLGAGYACYRITTATGTQSLNLSGCPADGQPGMVVVSFRGGAPVVAEPEPSPAPRPRRPRRRRSSLTALGFAGFAYTPASLFSRTLVYPVASSTPINGGDSGAGSDSIAIAAAIPGADAGAGSDSPSISAALSASDSGSGTDSPAIAAALTPSDASSGTDAAALAAAEGLSDSGAGSDSSSLAAAISASDSGAGSDARSIAAAIAVADSGAGTDGVVVDTNTPIGVSDSGSGGDSASLAAAIPSGESGSGSDSTTTVVTLTPTDTSSGAEAAAIAAAAGLSDTAAGSDGVNAAAAIAASDSGAGTDSRLLTAAITATDAAAGADSVFVDQGGVAFVARSDGAIGSDSILVGQGASPIRSPAAGDTSRSLASRRAPLWSQERLDEEPPPPAPRALEEPTVRAAPPAHAPSLRAGVIGTAEQATAINERAGRAAQQAVDAARQQADQLVAVEVTVLQLADAAALEADEEAAALLLMQ